MGVGEVGVEGGRLGPVGAHALLYSSQADALQQGGRGPTAPAEVVGPNYPINAETALECAVPRQTIVRPTRPHVAREGGLPDKEGAR